MSSIFSDFTIISSFLDKTKSQDVSSRKYSSSSQNSDSGPSDMSPRQQTVSPASLSQMCKECAKTEDHSMDLDKSCTEGESVVGGVTSQTISGLKVFSNVECRSETDLNVGRSFEKDRNSNMASLNVSSREVNAQKSVRLESLTENGNCDSIVSCGNQDLLQRTSDVDHTSSKHLDDTDQCNNEKQTVLESEDQEVREFQASNQSNVVKSCDLLKKGGILYSDDLVFDKGIRSEGKGQTNNASDQDRENVMGKPLIDSVLDNTEQEFSSQDVFVQNKENVVQKGSVAPTSECDMTVKVDLMQTEICKDQHWPGDMLKLTLEQGQITADSVNMFVVSESCDKIMSSAINADAKDVNFNSELQSH